MRRQTRFTAVVIVDQTHTHAHQCFFVVFLEIDTAGGRKCKNGSKWKKCVQKRRIMMGQSYTGRSRKEEPREALERQTERRFLNAFMMSINCEENRINVLCLVDVTPL